MFTAALAALASLSGDASAQRGTKEEAPEFTRQGLLIINFGPARGTDWRQGHRAADAVRARVGRFVNRRDVEVIDGSDINDHFDRAGYNADSTFDEQRDIRPMGKYMRADEYVLGVVRNAAGTVRLSGELVLMRDDKLRQPLAEVSAPRLDSAAALFAREIGAAQSQVLAQRRCENALRDGSGNRAIAAAREGVSVYPRSTLARTCLLWALRQTGPPTEVLSVAREVLALDSTNFYGIESAAIALDSLRRRDDAATMWLRLARTDTANLDLVLRVSYALFDGGNSRRGEPFITAAADAHPDNLQLVQQKWRMAYENKSWPHALDAGEVLLARDVSALGDSTFYLHLGTAYRAAGKPFKAIETLAHGVAAFPKDARMYSLYTQYIKAEADSVVPRGLALFPRSADLLALNAKELRARGKIQESLDATKQAVALDSTMAQGQLMVAQLELELGRPDSALAALHRAMVAGEDTTLVGQFALAKGNSLYRAASGTKASADFALAYRFLTFADTVRSSVQSKFLVGAAALGVAQAALTEAPKVKDKTESCRLARLGVDMVPVARSGLQAGQDAFAEAAKQSLDYLTQLDPYAAQALTAYCEKNDQI
ncbi:MAG TPA: hypothetical protein VN706_16660 [Gemmatimonadaceae bacterium]|nr:hypothetical protein [Gemmatimonadaceae bacterium]